MAVAEKTDTACRPIARCQTGLLSCLLLAAIAISLTTSPGPRGLLGAWLAALMLAIARADARRFIIPNPLTAAAFALALVGEAVLSPSAGALAWALVRAAAAAAPLLLLKIGYARYRRRDGLGMGDVKLAAVAGAWLDAAMIAVVIEVACVSAIAAYAIRSYRSGARLRPTAALPFGLFLGPAIWVGWLIQAWLSDAVLF